MTSRRVHDNTISDRDSNIGVLYAQSALGYVRVVAWVAYSAYIYSIQTSKALDLCEITQRSTLASCHIARLRGWLQLLEVFTRGHSQ